MVEGSRNFLEVRSRIQAVSVDMSSLFVRFAFGLILLLVHNNVTSCLSTGKDTHAPRKGSLCLSFFLSFFLSLSLPFFLPCMKQLVF